jgi:group I intron endonuclease
MGCLYLISFPNGKQYIGITIQALERRFYHHCYQAENGGKTLVGKALKKYGREKVECRVLVEADDLAYLQEIERRAIKAYGTKCPSGYNLTDGGEGTLGRPTSPETRQKMRDAQKNKSPETIEKLRAAASNPSPETRARMSASRRGKSPSPETRAKTSMTLKGRGFSPESNAKRAAAQIGRPVSQETRRKIGEGNRGKKMPAGFAEKIRAANTGLKRSEETKQRMAEAARVAHARTGKRSYSISAIGRARMSVAKATTWAVKNGWPFSEIPRRFVLEEL